MPKIQVFQCPACGANLSYDGGPEITFACQFCGTSVIVPEELRSKVTSGPAPRDLVRKVDKFTPIDSTFRMPVEDIFTIKGRGTVVTGRVESGTLKVGDEVQITGQAGVKKTAVVTGLEMFRKQLTEVKHGDNVGVLLTNVGKNDVQRGDVLEASSRS
jgi:translation elongation factor EF-Tu-like GTPase